jgi:hypothetical protein
MSNLTLFLHAPCHPAATGNNSFITSVTTSRHITRNSVSRRKNIEIKLP